MNRRAKNLKNGMVVNDMTGRRFGRLVAVGRAGSDEKGKATWRFKCDCGAETVARGDHVRRGRTLSCGCLRGYLSNPGSKGRYRGEVTVASTDSAQVIVDKIVAVVSPARYAVVCRLLKEVIDAAAAGIPVGTLRTRRWKAARRYALKEIKGVDCSKLKWPMRELPAD